MNSLALFVGYLSFRIIDVSHSSTNSLTASLRLPSTLKLLAY
jgi:hypothetical protein